jgi:hypothetical protein
MVPPSVLREIHSEDQAVTVVHPDDSLTALLLSLLPTDSFADRAAHSTGIATSPSPPG